MSPPLLLSVCAFHLIILTNTIFGYSFQYGQMDPAAVPIHEDEISWNCDERYIKYDDKKISETFGIRILKGNLKFTIILILVFDETPLDSIALAEIVQGGIGCNHTTMRLSCSPLGDSGPRSAKLNILIYGVLME